MGGAIGKTISDLTRYGMAIKVRCSRCERSIYLRARDIKNPKNEKLDFRRLRYRCRCGSYGCAEYSCPADWVPPEKMSPNGL